MSDNVPGGSSRPARALAAPPIAVALLTAVVAGCDAVPRDSAGAFQRILESRELRVGVAHHPPWAVVGDEKAHGIEVDVLERWAGVLGVDLRLESGAEAELIQRLHARDLDVVAAGLQSDSAFGPDVALTRPYLVSALGVWAPPGDVPDPAERVLAVTVGESRLLYELDRFLIAHRADWETLASRP